MSKSPDFSDNPDRSRLHLLGILTAVAASSGCNPTAAVDPDESPYLPSDVPVRPKYPDVDRAGGERGEGGGGD